MSKLLKLKEWVTLPEASRHLSGLLGEEVTEADIIRLALGRHLGLSIRFVDKFLTKQVRGDFLHKFIADIIEMSPHGLTETQLDNWVCSALNDLDVPDDDKYHSVGGLTYPGVWRLATRSAEPILNNLLHTQIGGSLSQETRGTGLIIKADAGFYCQVQAQPPSSCSLGDGDISGINVETTPAFFLPESASIVLRAEDIDAFQHAYEASPVEKPLSTTERNTLLTIIAALCDYSAIKHQERGAASQVARLTDDIGASVSADTVKRALEKIPDALEARMK